MIVLKPQHGRPLLLLSSAALFAVGVLSGCSFGSGGPPSTVERTHKDAESALTTLPYVTSATIETSFEGTPNQVLLMVRIAANDSFTANPADLLDYALGQAWSANERKPTTTVRIELDVEGQELVLAALASEIEVVGTVDATNKYDSGLRINVRDMEAAYGTWPGHVPVPASTLTHAGES